MQHALPYMAGWYRLAAFGSPTFSKPRSVQEPRLRGFQVPYRRRWRRLSMIKNYNSLYKYLNMLKARQSGAKSGLLHFPANVSFVEENNKSPCRSRVKNSVPSPAWLRLCHTARQGIHGTVDGVSHGLPA